MSNEPNNLVLEYLRAMRGDVSEIRETLRDHGFRLSRIESSVVGLRADIARSEEHGAHLETRIDRLRDDVDRIKRRLDLQEG